MAYSGTHLFFHTGAYDGRGIDTFVKPWGVEYKAEGTFQPPDYSGNAGLGIHIVFESSGGDIMRSYREKIYPYFFMPIYLRIVTGATSETYETAPEDPNGLLPVRIQSFQEKKLEEKHFKTIASCIHDLIRCHVFIRTLFAMQNVTNGEQMQILNAQESGMGAVDVTPYVKDIVSGLGTSKIITLQLNNTELSVGFSSKSVSDITFLPITDYPSSSSSSSSSSAAVAGKTRYVDKKAPEASQIITAALNSLYRRRAHANISCWNTTPAPSGSVLTEREQQAKKFGQMLSDITKNLNPIGTLAPLSMKMIQKTKPATLEDTAKMIQTKGCGDVNGFLVRWLRSLGLDAFNRNQQVFENENKQYFNISASTNNPLSKYSKEVQYTSLGEKSVDVDYKMLYHRQIVNGKLSGIRNVKELLFHPYVSEVAWNRFDETCRDCHQADLEEIKRNFRSKTWIGDWKKVFLLIASWQHDASNLYNTFTSQQQLLSHYHKPSIKLMDVQKLMGLLGQVANPSLLRSFTSMFRRNKPSTQNHAILRLDPTQKHVFNSMQTKLEKGHPINRKEYAAFLKQASRLTIGS